MYDYGRRNRRHETENPMIKLIATDVDGTLVKDGTMQIDPEYMTVIKELVQKGIIFAVCSGRQFISERKLFAPIKDQLLYITDGGHGRAHPTGDSDGSHDAARCLEWHVPHGAGTDAAL